MQTYICYVHTRGDFLPNVRLVNADNDHEASLLLMVGLRVWPSRHSIEMLEIFDDRSAPMRMRVDRRAPTH